MILPEEIVLLTLDDVTGEVVGRQGMAAGTALAGAVLMELSLLGRVDTDGEKLLLPSDAPTGHAVLDDALQLLTKQGPADSRAALMLLARDSDAMRAGLLAGLVSQGLLRQERGGFLRLFGTRYPKAAGREDTTAEVRSRLRDLVLGQDLPEPRDALLLCLVRSSGLLRLLFSTEELEAVQDRLNLLVKLEALNRSLGGLIADMVSRRLRAAGA
jgi:hypothetical protein